jgi:hypothetical protein
VNKPSWGGGLKPAEESLILNKSYMKFVNSKFEPTIKKTISKLTNEATKLSENDTPTTNKTF